jgi:hypothetical protein
MNVAKPIKEKIIQSVVSRFKSTEKPQPEGAPSVGNNSGVILMVGATGNGKSTLGNFLIDPTRYREQGVPFPRGNSNFPQTKACTPFQVHDLQYGKFVILDTPGLLERDANEDLRHMISIFEAVSKVGKIAGVILCVKYNNKLDGPACSLLEYYTKMFGDIMRSNLVLVLTHYTEDELAEEERKDAGVLLQPLVDNLKITLQGLLSGECGAIVPIDAFPSRLRPEAVESAVYRRKEIFDLIETMAPVESDALRLAKLPHWVQQDLLRRASIEGAVQGYIKRLIEVHPLAKSVANQLAECEIELQKLDVQLNTAVNEYGEKNTDARVVAKAVSEARDWRFLRSSYINVDLRSEHEIIDYDLVHDPNDSWQLRTNGKYSITGTITSRFMRGTSIHIIAYTRQRILHAGRIAALSTIMSDLQERKTGVSDRLRELRVRNRDFEVEMEQLQKEIDSSKEEIALLSSEFTNIATAKARLLETVQNRI